MPKRRWHTAGGLLLLGLLAPAIARGAERAPLDALVAAYPEALASHDGATLLWRDGTRMAVSDGEPAKDFEALLARPSILDMFALPYRPGRPEAAPGPDEDPGRFRNQAFFLKLYGDCRRGEVARSLRPVHWLKGRGGSIIQVTGRLGVAESLQRVSDELERLPEAFTRYLTPIAGTYNCRPIAGTDQLSMHAFGAAIDLNTAFGDYWRWAGPTRRYRNRVPFEIVEVFERHGFIWGGKWSHFDTFHFEYRPELLLRAGHPPGQGR